MPGSGLVGRTIVKVRPMTKQELKDEYWEDRVGFHSVPTVIVLDNGTKLYPAQDEEGNGPGALFGMTKDGRPIGFTQAYPSMG